ncbi:PREDICTED: trichohyalin-like [Trachymyrmex septentrionalis]|uniref:trichohyalin-like n=1 Tax=Trachymyrmex septentrionalis TaxID=34720 RepID=UPI00084F7C7D|nr:PREDICTED: trichohyalin-like [Trachymyrmex septentrionalis]
MGENQERSKKEIIKKIEDSNRDLEKKVMTELKKELEKMSEKNAKVIEELKKENVELRREVTELKKREEERERRERKKNIVIKGEQVEEGTERQVVEDLCNGICGEKIRVKEVRVIDKEEKIILVELENFEEKRKIMKNKYKLREKKIYVDEDMTRKERGIQKRVREWAYQEKKKGRMGQNGNRKRFCESGEGKLNGEQAEEMNEGEDGEQGRDRRLERETVEDGRTEKKEEICRDRVIDKSDSSKSKRKGGNERREGWESVKGRDESAGKRRRLKGEEESEGVRINVNECSLDERERERDGKEGRKSGRIGRREGKWERRGGIDKKGGEPLDNGDGSIVDKSKKQRDDLENGNDKDIVFNLERSFDPWWEEYKMKHCA